jgi:hypothetical protein
MSYLSDVIVFTSNNHFMLRINSTLRKLGIIDITCHKTWMQIGLRGEDVDIIIHYPDNLDHLPDAVEEEVRLQTPLYESNIQTIRDYISQNLKPIKVAIKQIKE